MEHRIPSAKKSLGQHFLRDANIARKIVKALEIAPGETVLEIGPGPGALTGFIHDYAPGRLVLVEKDPFYARQRMSAAAGALSVIVADALSMPYERFRGAWKCIGNLPYNVASPLLWELLGRLPDIRRAVFMVQKEVGGRIAAAPGTSAYGALSVWLQSFMRPKVEFCVPPQVFFPRPKVDSVVLSFSPLGARDRPAPHGAGINKAHGTASTGQQVRAGTLPGNAGFSPPALAAVLHLCFQKRRKQLGVILRTAGKDVGALERLGIDVKLRPEQLTVEEFQALGHSLFGKGCALP
jgi:16S rRNA (adenine1518-N6/adenine1519-N6)-dimethyltransferase